MKRCLTASLVLAMLASCSEAPAPVDTGFTYSLHRLNRVEYNNTVRDLLGTSLRPADHFPQDDVSHGFDNIASVLSLSPVQVEMYHRAAEQLITDALAPLRIPRQVIEGEDLTGATGDDADTAAAVSTTSQAVTPLNPYAQDSTADPVQRDYKTGAPTPEAWKFVAESTLPLPVPAPGTYRVTVLAWVERAGPTPVRMNVELNNTLVKAFDVLAEVDKPGRYSADITFGAEDSAFALRYTNDFDTGSRWRNLLIDSVTLEGPLGATEPNPLRPRIMTCTPDEAKPADCARRIVEQFATKAWRRPVTGKEMGALAALAGFSAETDPAEFDDAVGLALTAVLTSPNFVFRVEQQPASAESLPLSGYELASRLAYFLWSSTPDKQLFEAAASGALRSQRQLEAEIERMLRDPKAAAFVDNFAGQWLTLRGLEAHEPNRKTYPDYDLSLKADMIGETKRLFAALLEHNQPATELLTANYTFTTPRLAEHYGLQLPAGAEGGFVRVALPTDRLGLLGHASVLTTTSHPNRTSPVKRGKWVLEQLLCSAPPPPPPAVDGLPNEEQKSASLRERMEQHRADPVCAGCHKIMDPIGFGLEHYDGTGKWRDLDGDHTIDATGVLPDGRTFNGGVELAGLISTDPRFLQCVTRQMLTYALGQQPNLLAANQLAADWAAGGAGLRDLVTVIATSNMFRNHSARTPGLSTP